MGKLLEERGKITIAYALLYKESFVEPEFITDEPPYGWEKEPPKPTGFVVYGIVPMPPIFGDKYTVVEIEPEHSSKVVQAIQKKEHLARPVYFFSIPKTDKNFPHSVALASQIKTLEVILK